MMFNSFIAIYAAPNLDVFLPFQDAFLPFQPQDLANVLLHVPLNSDQPFLRPVNGGMTLEFETYQLPYVSS